MPPSPRMTICHIWLKESNELKTWMKQDVMRWKLKAYILYVLMDLKEETVRHQHGSSSCRNDSHVNSYAPSAQWKLIQFPCCASQNIDTFALNETFSDQLYLMCVLYTCFTLLTFSLHHSLIFLWNVSTFLGQSNMRDARTKLPTTRLSSITPDAYISFKVINVF